MVQSFSEREQIAPKDLLRFHSRFFSFGSSRFKVQQKAVFGLPHGGVDIHFDWLVIGGDANFEVLHDIDDGCLDLRNGETHSWAHSRSFSKWQIVGFVTILAFFFAEAVGIEGLGVWIDLWVPGIKGSIKILTSELLADSVKQLTYESHEPEYGRRSLGRLSQASIGHQSSEVHTA